MVEVSPITEMTEVVKVGLIECLSILHGCQDGQIPILKKKACQEHFLIIVQSFLRLKQ